MHLSLKAVTTRISELTTRIKLVKLRMKLRSDRIKPRSPRPKCLRSVTELTSSDIDSTKGEQERNQCQGSKTSPRELQAETEW